MASINEIESSFSALGGLFLTPAGEIAARAASAGGVVLDWDGVFNTGVKGAGAPSGFSEADSMGMNLLRFALWRLRGRLPVVAVITGEENPSAKLFASREHFDALYAGVRNKTEALEQLCGAHRLSGKELIAVFDDVNDLGVAARCGIRILVRRDSSPLLKEHVARRGLADYVTGSHADRHAVREAAELLLGLLGAFDAVVNSRTAWDADYVRYFTARQDVETRYPSP